MHNQGFSLIRVFTRFALLGAEWVMWLLIVLSVVSIALMFERGRFYFSLRDDLELLAQQLRDMLRAGDLDGARDRLIRSPSPAATIALAGLNEAEHGAGSAEEAMAGATARARMSLERYLAFLATLGNNAPFIGLFGTVIGIIQAFDALGTNNAATARAAGAANAAANAGATLEATGRVMGTIAEALVATAIGLLVAIPAVAAYNYFQRRVRAILSSGDTLSHVVLAHLKSTGPVVVPAAAGAVAASSKAPKAEEKKKPAEKATEKAVEKSDDDKKDKAERKAEPETSKE